MGDLERLLTHHCVPFCTCRWRHSALNCLSEKGVFQHKWSLQKVERELVCYSEAQALGSLDLGINPAPSFTGGEHMKILVFLSSVFLLSIIEMINILVRKL